MSNSKKILLTALAVLSTHPVHALNLQSYHFSDSYRYAILDDSLQEKFDGKYVATASYGYVNSPFYRSDTYLHKFRSEIIDANHVLTAGYTYYLSDHSAIGLDVSGVHNEVAGESFTTFGDSSLKGKFNFYRANDYSLSVNPQVIIPTGNGDNFSTMRSVSGALSVVAEKKHDRLNFLASVGGLSSKNNVYREVDHRQLLLTQLGVSYDVTEKLNLNLEAYRNFPLVNDIYQDEGKYYVTGKHKTLDRLSTYFGAGFSGAQELQRNTYSAFVGIKFHEAVPVAQALTTMKAAPVRMNAPTEEIYFDHDRSTLKPTEEEKLKSYVEYIQNRGPSLREVRIEGYASRVGLPAYNLRLSRKRAETVRGILVKQGVQENLLTTEAFGDTAPQVKDVGLNRKVKFIFKSNEVAHGK